MRGTFGGRLDMLRRQVGRGHLVGAVEVDQVYAHYQHEGLDFHHPDGGGPLFLTTPLFENSARYMAKLASDAIVAEGSRLHDAMASNMEHLSEQVYLNAPWEFGDLLESGHPTVMQNDEVIYDRKPMTGRLGPEELREKSRLRDATHPDRWLK